MDRESPELIEREMEQTRAALTEKVSALEQQVIGTIQDASQTVTRTVDSVKSAVQDTLHSVKDTVHDSVHTVAETMKHSLDLPRQTREHPWAMVGGATALGFVTGLLIFNRRESSIMAQGDWEGVPAASRGSTDGRAISSYQGATITPSRTPSWMDELMTYVGREALKIGQTALATASASLRQTVESELPRLISEGVPRLIGGTDQPTMSREYPPSRTAGEASSAYPGRPAGV